MAHKRGSERGVIQVASGLILAGFAALLGATGCSADQPSPKENLGTNVEALTCTLVGGGTQVCNQDDCTTFSCKGLTGGCVLVDQQKDGTACTTLTKETGRCVTPTGGNFPVCCTGCIVDNGRGVLTCIAKPDAKNCGIGGVECLECTKGDTCNPPVCITEKGVCDTQQVPNDKVACTDVGGNPGSCYGGVCCAGCIDANGACQKGNSAASCGKPTGAMHADCKNCVDANNCDGTETCNSGVCAEQVGFSCPTDGNVCHAPTCSGNNCSQNLLSGTNCPDANLCNGTEKCNNGVCNVPGTPKSCDDKNPCTLDDCDPKTGACINTPQGGSSCDDGNLCNGIGICDAGGACVVNPSPSCDDGEICTTDSCDPTPVTGGCKHANNTVACNDGDPCTTTDACSAGKCAGGPLKVCDDGNVCTTNSCKTGVGCQFAPLTGTACNDGNDCSTGDKCDAGVCTPTGGKICEPPTNPCKRNKCDNTTGGECQLVNDDAAKCRKDLCHEFSQCSGGVCPEGTPIKCDDGNPCTADTCDPEVGCVNTPDDKATCTDADLCTDTACKNGKCVTADAQCDPFDDCHIAGTCNPKSGFCDSPPAPPGTDCDSGAGKCDDKGKCIPNPVTGEGGAGGEGTMGPGGSGTGGTTTTDGGEPPVVGNGGNGNEPTTAGGDTGTEPNGGKAGKSNTGGDTVGEGGAPEIPRHVFVRDPGGCSCSVPSSQSSSLAWLGGLAMLGTAGALARRRRARLDGATRNSRVS
jgi:MYXO-CTERM domain-containing protein